MHRGSVFNPVQNHRWFREVATYLSVCCVWNVVSHATVDRGASARRSLPRGAPYLVTPLFLNIYFFVYLPRLVMRSHSRRYDETRWGRGGALVYVNNFFWVVIWEWSGRVVLASRTLYILSPREPLSRHWLQLMYSGQVLGWVVWGWNGMAPDWLERCAAMWLMEGDLLKLCQARCGVLACSGRRHGLGIRVRIATGGGDSEGWTLPVLIPTLPDHISQFTLRAGVNHQVIQDCADQICEEARSRNQVENCRGGALGRLKRLRQVVVTWYTSNLCTGRGYLIINSLLMVSASALCSHTSRLNPRQLWLYNILTLLAINGEGKGGSRLAHVHLERRPLERCVSDHVLCQCDDR